MTSFRRGLLAAPLAASFPLLTMAAVTLFSVSASALTDEERAGARAAAGAGLSACEAQSWQTCIDKFQKAESIVHSPIHLMYLGRAHLKLGHLVEAREAYLRISRDGAPAGASEAVVAAVNEANTVLPELEPRVPTTTVEVEGADGKEIKLFVDGKEISAALIGIARPVNPGRHEFKATAPGMISDPVTLELKEGEKKELKLVLKVDPNAPKDVPVAGQPAAPKAEQSPDPVLFWSGIGALGVGVAGVAVGTIFGLDSADKASQVKDLCGGDASNCQVDAGSSEADTIDQLNAQAGDSFTLQIIGYGVGAAGLLGGAALIYFSLPSEEAPPAQAKGLTVKPVVGFQYAGLRGTF